MKKHFKDLLVYNNWANEKLFYVLEDQKIVDKKMLDIFGHLISAQIVWLLRIQGLPTSPFPLWESYNKVELKSMLEETSRNWLNYLDSHLMDTFEEMIFYKDTKGRKHESTIRQIMSQMLLHSSYHRGQLNLMLRQRDIDPPLIDFISYTRIQ